MCKDLLVLTCHIFILYCENLFPELQSKLENRTIPCYGSELKIDK